MVQANFTRQSLNSEEKSGLEDRSQRVNVCWHRKRWFLLKKASKNKISPTRSCARSFRHDNICMGGWDNNMAVEMGVERPPRLNGLVRPKVFPGLRGLYSEL